MNGKKEDSVYLFIGQDIIGQDGLSRKHSTLERIKQTLLDKAIEDFSLDTLYSKDLTLKGLQEIFLTLAFKSKRRIIVIKEAQDLKDEIKDFILAYIKKPQDSIALVLDIECYDQKDGFVRQLFNYAKVFRFRETARLDTFTLSRSIEQKNLEHSLKVLNQLLREGEKPERILGGLRFAWEKSSMTPFEARKRLKLLLNCDIDIKTGKLKPGFALEKLVVALSAFGKPFR